MEIGRRLLDLAGSARVIFVVGTAKNVGKTIALRALASAAQRSSMQFSLTSTGRDGEAFDALDEGKKPRLLLEPGTLFVTARSLLPAHPASEIVQIAPWETPAGEILFARARSAAFYEIAGPVTAAAMHGCIFRLLELGSEAVLVDGAIDRVAVLAGMEPCAIVVATGAECASTIEGVARFTGSLVRRLSLPAFDSARPFVKVHGALTKDDAAAFVRRGERRQIVVRDPTQVQLSGDTFLQFSEKLALCCERPLKANAVTVASIGRDRAFEPRELLAAVASATGLPAFDVYAGLAA